MNNNLDLIKNNSSIESCETCWDEGDYYVEIPELKITPLITCDKCEKGLNKSE